MSKSVALDYHNPTVVRNAGLAVLKKELGIVGLTYFIRQFNNGRGDYTAEREEIFKDFSSDDIAAGIRAIQGMTE